MSYDIFFVRRDPGQSFEDALDDIEEAFQGDPGPLSDVDRELWETILPLASRILGDVEVFGDEATRELTHRETGIELSLFNGEVALRVPFGDFGEGSVEVMAKVYELSRSIERATGLEGYDPQLEEPVSDERGAATSRSVPRDDDDYDDDSPSRDGTSATPPGPRVPRDGAGAEPGPRRWWEFWKS